MSLKYSTIQESPNHYVLPKRGDMKVEVHAFLSEALWEQTDEKLWQQAMSSASYPGVIGAYLMPDTHLGYGIPIGGVIVTEDTIIQAGSGYDISCFTADTKVSLVDGRELTFAELVDFYGAGGEFYVYSMTPEGEVTAGKAHSPRKIRTDAPLVEVALDNGERVRCTPDHEWMLRDGTYRNAEDLLPGDSLMPLVCKSKAGLASHVRSSHNNHLVVAVRHLTEQENVFCLTVDKYTNFALSAGVFVHNCGVICMQVPELHASDIVDWDKRKLWVTEVEKRVATGLGSNRPKLMGPQKSWNDMHEILRYGAKPLGVSADLCERQFIKVPEDTNLDKIEAAIKLAAPQLGSVGGGNHFIEMQVDEASGDVWVMVHCGSRGYGWKTANHFFYEGARLRGLPSKRREESWLRVDEDLGKEYWAHHNSAANFAIANRHTIVLGVRAATREVFVKDPEVYYEISHNLVQQETLVLPDGTTKKGFVHRKGATRAFPPHHPDLYNTKWWETGHPCLIPGSMIAGAAILFPLEGAYKSGCSVNHGSGRKMARGQARQELRAIHDEIDEEMRTITRTLGGVEVKGIVANTARTPLDECGEVYKDLDEVLAVLENEGIAKVHHRMWPVANLKGM